MSVKSDLEKLGGCTGGQIIYFSAKALAEVLNVSRKQIALWPDTKKIMKHLFPDLNLSNIRFQNKCTLPGNWFNSNVNAMTFGYRIFHKDKDLQQSWQKLSVLMHELVHVDQLRKRNNDEAAFACDYGKGFLQGGSYLKNPMEKEAYDFVSAHPLPDSLPVSLKNLPKKP
jgi:hypothetical protein